MSYFWDSILQVFLPVSLLLAGHWAIRPCYGARFYAVSIIGAIATGILIRFILPVSQTFALGFALAQFVLLVAFLCWQRTRRREFFWHILLIVLAAVQWAGSPALLALTTTHVINTSLLLNVASVVSILLLCVLLSWQVCVTLRLLPACRWSFILLTAPLLLLPLSGNILLLLMKLQVLELTKIRLSYAAKTTGLNAEITYIALAYVFVLSLFAVLRLVRQRRRSWQGTVELIARRMVQADYRRVRNLQSGTVVIVLAMLAGQLYWDAVASQPPSLSAATRVEFDTDNQVHLPQEKLMDGNLHRFSWVSDDGKVVRFFVINRLADKIAPAVVFDACLLCGDQGYVQQGDQVVCIACGVYMFKPSIGKPGGCNPVPIEGWSVENGVILIPKEALESGLNLFSAILKLDVTDPVSGAKLTNTDAPFRYTYAGKTYFFATEDAQEVFRADPEKYIKGAAL